MLPIYSPTRENKRFPPSLVNFYCFPVYQPEKGVCHFALVNSALFILEREARITSYINSSQSNGPNKRFESTQWAPRLLLHSSKSTTVDTRNTTAVVFDRTQKRFSSRKNGLVLWFEMPTYLHETTARHHIPKITTKSVGFFGTGTEGKRNKKKSGRHNRRAATSGFVRPSTHVRHELKGNHRQTSFGSKSVCVAHRCPALRALGEDRGDGLLCGIPS